MSKKTKKLDMDKILNLGGYETVRILTEEEFIQHVFDGNLSFYGMMSGRKGNNLLRRKPEVERLVIERGGKFLQVDVKAEIFMGE